MPRCWARLQSVGRPDWYIEFPSSYAVQTKPFTIGRHPASTLCLTDNMTISNRHVTLEQQYSESSGKRTVILHETSSNGTTINGTQYQKGQTIELTNNAEIIFPQEDDKPGRRQDFVFIFHIFDEESEEPKDAGKANLAERSEWALLQDQCDDLTRELARLAASVYSNNDKIHSLADTMRPTDKGEIDLIKDDPLVRLTVTILGKLKLAEDRLKALGDTEVVKELDVRKWQEELERFGVAAEQPDGTKLMGVTSGEAKVVEQDGAAS